MDKNEKTLPTHQIIKRDFMAIDLTDKDKNALQTYQIIKRDFKAIDLTDNELYERCQKYGQNAKGWLMKFAGLLPEVYRRGLYRKKGFVSINEFAKKIAGMSENAVDRILQLSVKLQDKPILLNQLESGEQHWNKIAKVAYIATPGTDKILAEKIKTLSYLALNSYVQEKRKSIELEKGESVFENNSQSIEPMRQPSSYLSFQVTADLEQKLRVYKQKLEKERKVYLSWGETIEALLKGKTYEEKQILLQICPDCAKKKAEELNSKKEQERFRVKNQLEEFNSSKESISRKIPAIIEKMIMAKYGNICAFRNCGKPWELMHHVKRFSISKNHDPDNIVPLCKKHHTLAHAGLIANENDSPEKWYLRDEPDKNDPAYNVDKKVQEIKAQSLGKNRWRKFSDRIREI